MVALILVAVSGCKKAEPFKVHTGLVYEVTAAAETEAVKTSGDTLDDPAIWVHPTDRTKSLIIGSNKAHVGGGLHVYNLEGRLIHSSPVGRVNNVDVRYGFPLGDELIDIVVASHRGKNTLTVMKVDPDILALTEVGQGDIKVDFDVYGLCLYKSGAGKFYAFVTSTKGKVAQYELFVDASGKIDGKKVRSFDVGSKAEGCVADDKMGVLYIAEEDIGIWKYRADPGIGNDRVIVDRVGANLKEDVEGLTLYHAEADSGYLIASSQGNSTYAVYRREGTNQHIANFEIKSGPQISGTQSTDGIAVTNVNLGPQFPNGLFVAHDDRRRFGKGSNFKLVPWERIARTMTPALVVATGYDPRK